MKTFRRSLTLLPGLLVVACSHTMPQYTAKPVPPPQYQAPSVAAVQVPPSQLPDSALPVTLVLDLSPIERAMQAAMPERFNEKDHGTLRRDYRWDFVRDGEPQVNIQDGMVNVRTMYRGDIEAKTESRGCRLDPVFPVLTTTGPLELRQEGNALVLGMKNPQMDIDITPESDSKCNMFNVPVKLQLAELFNKGEILQNVKTAVEQGNFRIPLQQVWTRLESPVAVTVANVNTQACLYGKPVEMAIGNLKGTTKRTTIPIVVKETPTATFEAACHTASSRSMKVTAGNALLEGQPYKVLASVAVPYAALNQAFQEKLYHQQMTFGGMMKDNVIIEQVTAADSSGKVLITVPTSGDLNGTIYYWGTPKLESGGSVMTVPDLQMASESKAMLDGVKVGYWQMIDQQLRDKLQTVARVDLSDRIAKMKTAMTGTHRTGDLTMDVQMARYQAQRAYSTPGALVADILFEGTASATAPIAMESTPGSDKILNKAPVVSHR